MLYWCSADIEASRWNVLQYCNNVITFARWLGGSIGLHLSDVIVHHRHINLLQLCSTTAQLCNNSSYKKTKLKAHVHKTKQINGLSTADKN